MQNFDVALNAPILILGKTSSQNVKTSSPNVKAGL